MERRRKLWRSRQQRGGRQWGRLGGWGGQLGRPKPPSLEPIPEEPNSHVSSPSCGAPGASGSVFHGGLQEGHGDLRQGAVASAGGVATANTLGVPGGVVWLGSPPRLQAAGADSAGGSPGGVPAGARGRNGSNSDGGVGNGGGGGSSAQAGLFGGRRGRGGAVGDGPEAYRPLAGDMSPPDVNSSSGERDGLLAPQPESCSSADADSGPAASCGPPASITDMPGEEPSFLRTLAALLSDIGALAVGQERRALWLALGLAFFNQATASTAIINYAPSLLRRLGGNDGVDEGSAMLYTVVIGITKAVGVVAALLLVDHCGRRPLLMAGSVTCSVALVGLTVAAREGNTDLLEVAMCVFTLFFSLSWAGLYWVVVSELFSMTAKSAATSAATGLLFLTGAITDLIFLSLEDWMGAYIFLAFAALCLASAVYVWLMLPETKGRTLAEVQSMLAPAVGPSDGASGAGDGRGHLWVQLQERRTGGS